VLVFLTVFVLLTEVMLRSLALPKLALLYCLIVPIWLLCFTANQNVRISVDAAVILTNEIVMFVISATQAHSSSANKKRSEEGVRVKAYLWVQANMRSYLENNISNLYYTWLPFVCICVHVFVIILVSLSR